jgi:hypothetical protein
MTANSISLGKPILVDTDVGNDRERPQVPQFAGLPSAARRARAHPLGGK